MRLSKLGVLVLLACIILVEICDGRGRGGGRGKGNSRWRSGGSRGGSRSPSKGKTTKHSPIQPTTRTTPVIVSQAKVGSRSNIFKKVLVGYLVLSYARHISSAPVYRVGYPMHGRYVGIPEKRAVRVMSTETRMLNHDGKLCLDEEERDDKRNIGEAAARKSVIEGNTTIRYGEEKPLKFNGINLTLREKEGVDFEVVSRTRYNSTLVAGKDCVIVEERLNGTVLHMYETNPDGASTVVLNAWLLLFSTLSALFWLKNQQ